MRRVWAGSLVAIAAALIIAACGGGTGPTTIQPPPPPPVVNTPPVVKSIAVSDSRVEAGAPVTLTATVEDAETPVANLLFSWAIPQGSVTGTGNGSTITFTPSTDLKTPADYEITLTVTERYTGTGGVQAENKATGSVTLHVNNSSKELADLSLRFLGDFVNSRVSPTACVAEFSDSCSTGKKSEFEDVDDNRHDYEIIASTLRHTSFTIASNRVSATVHTFCSFTSKVITTQPRDEYCLTNNCALGSIQGPVTGDCITTNVYQNGRWWLCTSSFGPLPGQALTAFARAFFHMDRHQRNARRPIGR